VGVEDGIVVDPEAKSVRYRSSRRFVMPSPLFTDVNHVCIVTHDLDRAVRTWADRYGTGPWNIWTKDPSNMSAEVQGEPSEFAFRVALCQISPTFRLEIIQPLDDRSPYARSLAERGADHVHHVRFDIADYEAAADRLDALGVERLFHGEFDAAPGVDGRFVGTYFATEDELGFIVEIGKAPEAFAMPAPAAVYPPSGAA
jgi:methylmalonyl-CoA/ethylmalonyl-CoA epimerase